MEKIKVLKQLLMNAIQEAYADDEVTAEEITNEVLDFASDVFVDLYEDALCAEDILEDLEKRLVSEDDYVEELVHILELLEDINVLSIGSSEPLLECFKTAAEEVSEINVLHVITDYSFVIRIGDISIKVIGMIGETGNPIFGRTGKVSCYDENGYVRDLTEEEIQKAYQKFRNS